MFLSVFDLFKIGIGPSSSHTVGPMAAMNRFCAQLGEDENLNAVVRVQVSLHGSLAFTGKGHGTDKAVVLGLLGEVPSEINPDAADGMLYEVLGNKRLNLGGTHSITFDMETDVPFDFGPPLEGHTNGMIAKAFDVHGAELLCETYFSIGGGFVVTEAELNAPSTDDRAIDVPYPFSNAKEMLAMGAASELSIADMKRANEAAVRSPKELEEGLRKIWVVMEGCMSRGLRQEGYLPGGLNVKRRAKTIFEDLKKDPLKNVRYDHSVMDWISLYALAVNEENAAGGRIVTSPTNGAAGIIPAVIKYYLEFCPGAGMGGIDEFLLTASAIGGLIKTNASISGAEVGCQGEVGSASAMAAAGLCAVLGGTNAQIENAAEIAIEHHLGMTCDPIAGLVQVPCIERNAMGAVKAVNAASMALRGDGSHFVPLDNAIETMRQTGIDMLSKYKETSQGGLAVNVTEC